MRLLAFEAHVLLVVAIGWLLLMLVAMSVRYGVAPAVLLVSWRAAARVRRRRREVMA